MAQHYTIQFHNILDLSMIIPLQGYMFMWISYSCCHSTVLDQHKFTPVAIIVTCVGGSMLTSIITESCMLYENYGVVNI